jgi:hypothetical protein
MSEYTKRPWVLVQGTDFTRIMAGSGKRKVWVAEMVEDENYSGDDIIPDVGECEANGRIAVCAPEMAEMLLDLYHGRKTNGDIDALLKKAGVLE